MLSERAGIPLRVVPIGANRHDAPLLRAALTELRRGQPSQATLRERFT